MPDRQEHQSIPRPPAGVVGTARPRDGAPTPPNHPEVQTPHMTAILAAPPSIREPGLPESPYLVADLFCGAGGSSTGAQRALNEIGAEMNLVAVNHWPVAVETHQTNHPSARHYVQDLDQADPETIVPEGYLDLLMASPECRFYSRARGGKPIHDQGRMHPWVVHHWLTSLEVRCLLVENVPEFTSWGPLKNGRPDKARRGIFFQEWINSIWGLGYDVEWRVLNAADFGDATTRVRFFLMARNDGRPIRWPQATHSRHGDADMLGHLPRWRAAREIIDWSNTGRSILDDPKYQRKPLSEKTKRRIARGLEKFGGPLAPLYVRLLDLPDPEGPAQAAGPGLEPQELQAESGGDHPQPFLVNRHGDNGSPRVHTPGEPVPTITTRGAGYLVEPEAQLLEAAQAAPHGAGLTSGGLPAVQARAHSPNGVNPNNNAPGDNAPSTGSPVVNPGTSPFVLGQQSQAAPRSDQDPLPTVAGAGAISLIRPIVIQYPGQAQDQEVHADIQSRSRQGMPKPVLVEHDDQCAGVEGPVPAAANGRRHTLATPSLVEINHGNGPQGDRGNDRRVHPVDQPLWSITTAPGIALVEPLLVQTGQTGGNGGYTRPAGEPVPTITTRNDMNVVSPLAQPYVVPNFGEREGQKPRTHSIDEPAPAVTSRGAGALVSPTLAETVLGRLRESGTDPRRLVFINGVPHLLDIRFRMLKNLELARAMGFDDEETSYEFAGNATQVTKQIGNAVPVHLASALVRAVLDPAGNPAAPAPAP